MKEIKLEYIYIMLCIILVLIGIKISCHALF